MVTPAKALRERGLAGGGGGHIAENEDGMIRAEQAVCVPGASI